MPRGKKKGVESDSSRLFRLISESQGLSVQEISEKLGWPRNKTNRMLSTLEKKGRIVKMVFAATQPRILTKPEEAAQHLSDKFERLVEWRGKLEAREKELFDLCVSAQVEGDKTKAAMYANQCAEIRKIIGLVTGTEQMLSKVLTPEE